MSNMGTGEMGGSTKTTKTSTPQQQEQPPTTTAPMAYPDWAAAFQAYYGSGTAPMPPPGYFPSTVGTGPQPHPYMWGAQHLMPPYGTPPPYAAMYPHAGIYGHPSMPPGATHPYSAYSMPAGHANEAQGGNASGDGDGKSGDGKSKSSNKKSKSSLGSLGMITGKGNEPAKGAAGPTTGALSHSHDSGSEGSSDGSEGNSQYGSDGGRKGADQSTTEVANATTYAPGVGVPAHPISIGGKQVVGAGPITNLNIGMDYWSSGSPAVVSGNRTKRGMATATTAIVPSSMGPGRDGNPNELWLQDERELKRQRRKQSNRESARRSRLRKQAECDELAAKVESLTNENSSLRNELARITEQCNKLSSENSSLSEQLKLRGIQRERITEDVDMNGKTDKRDVEQQLQVDNDHNHFRRESREANDTFTVSSDGGNLAVSVSSG